MGLRILAASHAPRWAIRAARLFVQARLAPRAHDQAGDLLARWRELHDQFDEMAQTHGARWREVPWEGLLTAGWAHQALVELTPWLRERSERQTEAIQCLRVRFAPDGACDPIVATSFVSWLVMTADQLDHPMSYGDHPVDELVLFWLRGVARQECRGEDISAYRALRSQIRDVLLRRAIEPGEDDRWESLALLGSDSTEDSTAALRALARRAPAFLIRVVESGDVATLMSVCDVGLLAELAEAYYVIAPGAGSGAPYEMGIRGHEPGGLFLPLAAAWRGPFVPLLRADVSRGLALIERMVDQAARVRLGVAVSPGRAVSADPRAEESEGGLWLDLPGLGRRLFVGDEHVWSWYRGTSVGPHPCMSALLALETLLDECVRLQVPLRTLAERVLQGATTVATVSLVLGFLVRHLEEVTDELDGFLAVPQIWALESFRAQTEERAPAQVRHLEGLADRERRAWKLGHGVGTSRRTGGPARRHRGPGEVAWSWPALAGSGRRGYGAAGGAPVGGATRREFVLAPYRRRAADYPNAGPGRDRTRTRTYSGVLGGPFPDVPTAQPVCA